MRPYSKNILINKPKVNPIFSIQMVIQIEIIIKMHKFQKIK